MSLMQACLLGMIGKGLGILWGLLVPKTVAENIPDGLRVGSGQEHPTHFVRQDFIEH